MKENSDKLNLTDSQSNDKKVQGYPIYPESEDIYTNFKKEENVNPEDTTKTKEPNSSNVLRIKGTDESVEKDMDIPGAELDDLQEDIGSEDEENNYYSLGGDDHLDLEENQGK